jgi:hypothetical protein
VAAGQAGWCRRFSQCRVSSTSARPARTPSASKNSPTTIAMIAFAVPPVSGTVAPQPSHTGARTVIGRSSGTVPGQLARMPRSPWIKVPSVIVVQPLRPQSWPYDVGRNVAVGAAPAR